MKVIFILSRDSYNIPAVNVIKEMQKRNYEIDFYGIYMENLHIGMIAELNVLIKPLTYLDINNIKDYDFIYSVEQLDVLPLPLDIKIYIFTFSISCMNEPAYYADYTFIQRDMNINLQETRYLNDEINYIKVSPGMKVGNPKYESVKSVRPIISGTNKKILFIDAGHFPFGERGKLEEARMLLDIAKRFPDYILTIKPRFFSYEKNVSHKNDVHIYECLDILTDGNLPSNIQCLKHHVNLEELVQECDIIITTDLTTTYLDIAAYDKPGIIATGLPSEFSVSHTPNLIKRFVNIEKRSGLCIPYNEVTNYLPKGKKCKSEHKQEMGLEEKNSAFKIVEKIEEIVYTYIKKKRYPGPQLYELNFSTEIENNISLDEVISLRYIKRLYRDVGRFVYQVEELNFSEIIKYINELFYKKERIDAKNFNQYNNLIKEKMHDVILNNREKMMKNMSNQSYYLDLLYTLKKLKFEKEQEYQAKELYWCLKGKEEIISNGNARKALEFFLKYFHEIRTHTFEKTLADTKYYIESATFWTGYCYYNLKSYKEAKEYFLKCQQLTNDNHKKAQEYLDILESMNI